VIENIGLNDIAVAFVETLVARGVTLKVRGSRLAYHPKNAYGELSNDERATLKQHKAAIVAVVRGRYAGTAGPHVQAATLTPSEGVAPTVAPAHVLCKWCNRAPCIGVEHEAFGELHPDAPQKPTYDLAELRRCGTTVKDPFTSGVSADADDPTAVMMRQLGKLPDWY
jgi:hypothetical protein